MENEISQTIIILLSQITKKNITLKAVLGSDNFLRDFGLDSIAILRIIMEIERAFDIKIETYELDLQLFSKFSKLVGFVGAKCDQKNCRLA